MVPQGEKPMTAAAPNAAPTLEPGAPPLPAVAGWYVAARSDQLRRTPLSRRILGRSLVLYRDSRGLPVGLEDRCPHKNVALSIGTVRGDRIVCRYHGWAFDSGGRCVDVPCHSPDERLPTCTVPRHPTVEQDGWVWVWMGGPAEPAALPPAYPRAPGYRWFELHNLMAAPLDLILENGLDCSHTGFAHDGLFRSAPTRFAEARIEETPTGLRVETVEPAPERTRDFRSLLGGRRQAVSHVDEIILPHTLRVDYHLGARAHVVTILVATPEDEWTTRVYTRMGVRYGAITGLMTPVIHWITRRVVAQDREVLENQAATMRAHGGRAFRAVVADQPATWFQRVLRRHQEGKCPPAELRRRTVQYKL
jgi:phenylpropionate dioxygenase-like ring-hydroxylating dioxygenase large terminal subunit